MLRSSWIVRIAVVALGCLGAEAMAQQDRRGSGLLERSAAEIVRLGHDCVPGSAPAGAPQRVVPFGPRSTLEAGSGARAQGKLGLLIAGFDRRTSKISEEHQDQILDQLLQRLTYQPVSMINPQEIPFLLDSVMEAFGAKRGIALGKEFDKLTFDLMVKLDGEYIGGKRAILVKTAFMRRDGSCYSQPASEEIAIEALPTRLAPPRDVISDAVTKLFTKHKGAQRIVILPTLVGATPIEAVVADPLEKLMKETIERLGKSAEEQDRTREMTKGGNDVPPPAAGVSAHRISQGEYIKGGAGKGDWLVRLKVGGDSGTPTLAVELREAATSVLLATEPRAVAPQLLGAFRLAEPIAELLSQAPIEVSKVAKLKFSLKINRPAHIYCALQDFDGESYVLFPDFGTTGWGRAQSGRNWSYPGDMESVFRLDAETPGYAHVRCFAALERLGTSAHDAWRSASVRKRATVKGLAPALTGSEFAELVTAVRAGGEVHETQLLVQVVDPKAGGRR